MMWTKIVLLTLSFMLPLGAIGFAQNPPTASKKRRPAARPKQPPVNAQAEATKVAEQIKLATRFLYVYGKISAGLETAEEQARRGELSQELKARMAQHRTSLVENIRGLRAGIEKLEQSYQSGPRRAQISHKLIGASDGIAQAEQLATAGRLEEAGRALLTVTERLVDFLVETR